MRILVTNDDGIQSIGLKLLAIAAQKYGDVIVVAPAKEQSAKSQALNIKHGFHYEKIDSYLENVEAYSVDSTPADCVRFANFFLRDEYDITFSGINNGYNLGEDIMYSGTVGAASEAVMGGKLALAISTAPNDLAEAEKRIDDVLAYVFEKHLFDHGNLYNINIPLKAKSIKLTRQGSTHFSTIFLEEARQVYQRGKPNFHLDEETEDSDVYAIYENYISITPLTVDRTDYQVLNKIKNGQN